MEAQSGEVIVIRWKCWKYYRYRFDPTTSILEFIDNSNNIHRVYNVERYDACAAYFLIDDKRGICVYSETPWNSDNFHYEIVNSKEREKHWGEKYKLEYTIFGPTLFISEPQGQKTEMVYVVIISVSDKKYVGCISYDSEFFIGYGFTGFYLKTEDENKVLICDYKSEEGDIYLNQKVDKIYAATKNGLDILIPNFGDPRLILYDTGDRVVLRDVYSDFFYEMMFIEDENIYGTKSNKLLFKNPGGKIIVGITRREEGQALPETEGRVLSEHGYYVWLI